MFSKWKMAPFLRFAVKVSVVGPWCLLAFFIPPWSLQPPWMKWFHPLHAAILTAHYTFPHCKFTQYSSFPIIAPSLHSVEHYIRPLFPLLCYSSSFHRAECRCADFLLSVTSCYFIFIFLSLKLLVIVVCINISEHTRINPQCLTNRTNKNWNYKLKGAASFQSHLHPLRRSISHRRNFALVCKQTDFWTYTTNEATSGGVI